jgi:hypothetical protein
MSRRGLRRRCASIVPASHRLAKRGIDADEGATAPHLLLWRHLRLDDLHLPLSKHVSLLQS